MIIFDDNQLKLHFQNENKKLGEGTNGIVLLYKHKITQKKYALKLITKLPPDFTIDE